MDSLLPFPPSKVPVILSRLVCHGYPLLPRPLNSLNNTCLNDAPRTKSWVFHLEGNLKFQQAFFVHFLLSQSADCYTQPCETPSFCQIKPHWLFSCLVLLTICSYQVMLLSNNNFFSPNVSIGWANSKRQTGKLSPSLYPTAGAE